MLINRLTSHFFLSPESRENHLNAKGAAHWLKLSLALVGVLFIAMPRGAAQTLYWDTNGTTAGSSGAAGTWGTNTFWSTSSVGTSATTGFTSGRDTVFSAGTNATGAYTVTVSGTQNVSSIKVEEGAVTFSGGTINFNDATPDFTVNTGLTTTVNSVISGTNGLTKNGAGTLTLTNTNTFTGATTFNAGTISINATGGTLGTAPGAPTANMLVFNGGTLEATATFVLNTNRGATINAGGGTFDIDSGATLTYDGVIAGTGVLTKTDTGTLALSGANTFTGATSISAGVLNVHDNTALGTAAAGTTVASGATLEVQGNITVTGEALTLSGAGVGGNGALRNLSGANTLTGNITLAASSTIQSDAGMLTLSGGINGSVASRNLTVDGAGDTTISGVVGPNISDLTKDGAGTLTLGSANTYTGDTTLNAGVLSISAGNRLGVTPGAPVADKLVFNGGTLETTATTLINNNRGVTINAGGGTIDVNAATTLGYAGILTGTGTLTKAGTGTFTLDGATTNTHTGNINVNAGTLEIAKTVTNTAIGDIAAVTVASGATLAFNGGVNETIGSLAGAGAVNNINASAFTLTTGGNNTSTNFSGVIADTGGNFSLVKNGTGTQTLSGATANTYAGATTVNDGTLALNKSAGVNAVGPGAVTVGNGVGAAGSANLVLLASNQISNNTALTLNSDGRLALGTFAESIGSLAGTGLVDLSTSGYLTVGANNSSSSFGGSITGTGTLEKTGTGSLTFNSAINYAGALTLSGGSLILNGTAANIDSLNITGNSTISFSGTASTLSLANLTISAGVTLTIVNWANATDFFYVTNWNGAVIDTRGMAPMNQVVFATFTGANTQWQGYDHQITPVPEPSTYGAILLAALFGFFALRRSRRLKLSLPLPAAV